jgi:hypothetical protein
VSQLERKSGVSCWLVKIAKVGCNESTNETARSCGENVPESLAGLSRGSHNAILRKDESVFTMELR